MGRRAKKCLAHTRAVFGFLGVDKGNERATTDRTTPGRATVAFPALLSHLSRRTQVQHSTACTVRQTARTGAPLPTSTYPPV